MNPGDFGASAARLQDAWKALQRQRLQTRTVWTDAQAQRFEREFIDPLEPKFLRLIEGIGRLSQVFLAARHECQLRDDVIL
jgi:hypothetical protein